MANSQLENLPHLECILDFQGNIKRVNAVWQQQLGIMVEHLLITTFKHWVHPDDLKYTQDSFAQLCQGKTERIVFECRWRDIAGKYRWLLWVATVSLTDKLIYAMGLEMPTRQRYETCLHAEDQYYQAIIQAIFNELPEGIVVYDADGKMSLCNPSAEKILGISSEHLLEQSDWELVMVNEQGSELPKASHPVAVTLDTGKACTNQVIGIYKPDNSFLWLNTNSQPLHLHSDKYTDAVFISLTDISEHKQTENSLREQLTFLSSLFKAISVGIAVTDESGQFIYVNPAYCQLYGYRSEELLGQPFTMLLPPSLRSDAIQSHADFLAGNKTLHEHGEKQHREGDILNHSVVESKFLDENGKPLRVTVVTASNNLSTETEEEQIFQVFDLKYNETWLRRLIRQLPVTLLSLDRQGRLTFAEGQYLAILGLDSHKTIGQSIFDVSQRLASLVPDFQRALGGETFNKYIVYAGVSFKTKYTPLLRDNEWIGTLVAFHDITEQRALKWRLEKTLQEVELLASHTSLGLIYLEQQKIVRVNQQCAVLLGYTQTELLTTPPDQFYPSSKEYQQFQQQSGLKLAKGMSYQTQQWLRKKNGTYLYCQLTVKALNQSHKILWLLEEVCAQKQAQTGFGLQAALWTNTNDAILVTDPQLYIQQANPASTHLTGYPTEELIKKSLQDLNTGQQDTQFYKHLMDTMKQQGQWQGGIWQRHKNNAAYVCELKLQAYDTEIGKASRYVAILSNKQTCDSAFLDPLTNLPSRQLFRYKLLKTHAHAQRQKKLFAVLLISIDNLSVINSEYGCALGDQLLYMVGQSLKSSVRDSDSVARYGGNLFGVNLSEISKSQDATLVSQMILFKLTQTFSLRNHSIQGIISIGIAVYPEDSTEADTLLELAEKSMQRAKEQGGNQCHFHNPMLQQQYC